MNKLDALSEVLDQVKKCKLCHLCEQRKQVVFARGALDSNLIIIGESPGSAEDEAGIPFCGKCGKELDKWIADYIEMCPVDIYICNVCKCRPPDNRPPSSEEMLTCVPFLLRQIEIVKPKIILALGATASKGLTKDYSLKITQERGQWKELEVGGSEYPTMLSFHPSYVLRQHSEEVNNFVKKDFLSVKQALNRRNDDGV